MSLLANDPIMKKRLIQLFRHLEYQNPSIISGTERRRNEGGGTVDTMSVMIR